MDFGLGMAEGIGDYRVARVAARRYVRKLRGGAQAHLLEGDDGHHYAVKFTNNPQHHRILVNEFVGHLLMCHLGINTPAAALFSIDEEFLRNHPEMFIAGRCRVPVEPGVHFGSRLPVDPRMSSIYDFLPDPMLSKVANFGDFLGALVFDKWTGNTDARQAVFARQPYSVHTCGWHVWMIDNGFIFGGSEWKFRDAPLAGLFGRRSIYSAMIDESAFKPWIEKIVDMPRNVLSLVANQVPDAWMECEKHCALDHVLDQLDRRRQRLGSLLEDAVRIICGRNRF